VLERLIRFFMKLSTNEVNGIDSKNIALYFARTIIRAPSGGKTRRKISKKNVKVCMYVCLYVYLFF